MASCGTEPNIKEETPSYDKVWRLGKCIGQCCKVGKVFAGGEWGKEKQPHRSRGYPGVRENWCP
uniref:Uncharacterized protein n=1 Tax=Romanomermis culicivorax TaxID=13658 RepID=A0A915KXA8_ROMCU